MIRTARAFMWLRWRLLVNGLRGGQRRDRLEQISRALALATPLLLAALSAGSAIGLGLLGLFGGLALASGSVEPALVFFVAQFLLLVFTGLVFVFSVASPVQSTLSRYTRLLLLPVSRRLLHLVEAASSLADPWILMLVPGLLLVSIGLAAGGRPVAAITALLASVLLVLVLAALASVGSLLVAWLFRNRRRSEVFTLILVLVMSLVSFVPMVVMGNSAERRREARATRADRVAGAPARLEPLLNLTRGLPTWAWHRAVQAGLDGRPGAALGGLALLAAQGVVLFGLSSAVHGRLIGSVEGDRGRRRGRAASARQARVPGMSATTTAVAVAQFRTAVRSVRGRLVVLMPGPLLAVLTMVIRQAPDEAGLAAAIAANGHLLFGAGVIFGLYALQPFTMNMFASDRAGLTLQFLAPVSDVALARGKVAGCGLLLGATTALCLVAAVAVSPSGSPLLWATTLLGGTATYLLLCPIGVWLSALFPVAADLSKTGSGGNPHTFPMVLGTFLVVGLAAPAVLILLATGLWMDRAVLGLGLMAGWTLVATAIALPLITIASRAVGARRENLAVVAQGR